MFDLNAIVSAALNAAVAEAIKPLVERMGLLEAALADRHERLAALENNPAIGTDTTLTNRIAVLEERMDNITEASEDRIRVIAEAAAEQVMEDHTSSYDHDEYDSVYNEWGSEEVSDFVKEGDLDEQIEEKVKEALNNAHFTISI